MDKIKSWMSKTINGNPNSTAENVVRGRTAAIVLMSSGVFGALYRLVTSPETMVLNLATLLVPVAIGLGEVIHQGIVASKKEKKLLA